MANLVTSNFILGRPRARAMGPFSEAYGRKPILVVTYALFTVFRARTDALAQHDHAHRHRFISGLVASSPFTVGPGIIVDLWAPFPAAPPPPSWLRSCLLGP